jgi:predicted GTPase
MRNLVREVFEQDDLRMQILKMQSCDTQRDLSLLSEVATVGYLKQRVILWLQC